MKGKIGAKQLRLWTLASFSLISLSQATEAAPGTWMATGSMITARGDFGEVAGSASKAILVANGKVLVAGGVNFSGSLASAELYDPTTGTWSPTGSMNTARYASTITLLQNGKVLVAGGENGPEALVTAEVYDPAVGTWSPTGSMATARWLHAATLLHNGKVLVTGGLSAADGSGIHLTSAELYEPVTGTWSPAGYMVGARRLHTSTLLPGGKVLVVGGINVSTTLSSAELYDPSTSTWSVTGSMMTPRITEAILLPSGRVLVAGGFGFGFGTASAELFNPATGTWSSTGSLTIARLFHTTTLLPSGKVLVAAGSGNTDLLSSAEIYDSGTGTWSVTGSMITARSGHGAIVLSNGKLLVAGGADTRGTPLASAELFEIPAAPPPTVPLPPTILLTLAALAGVGLFQVTRLGRRRI